MKPSNEKDQKETELEESFKSCEECGDANEDYDHTTSLCPACHEFNFCECGQRLEDSWGTPGDGFCIKCR